MSHETVVRRRAPSLITALSLLVAACSGARTPGPTSGASPPAVFEPIIDTHTHFYDPTRPNPTDPLTGQPRAQVAPDGSPVSVPYPSKTVRANGKLVPNPIHRKVMPNDFFAVAAPLGITGAVVVEASRWIEDNTWVLQQVADDPRVLGFIGNLSQVMGTSLWHAYYGEFKKHPKFRGMRLHTGDLDKGVASFDHLKQLAADGLVLDVNVEGESALATVGRFAELVPQLTIVVNHLGNVKLPVQASWKRSLSALKAHPNVFVKFSGIVESNKPRYDQGAPGDLATYTAFLDHAWREFGEDRLIFGSNWPQSSLWADLPTVVNLARGYLATKSPQARQKVLRLNAERVYRLRPTTAVSSAR
jgi:L-fuconolactonase